MDSVEVSNKGEIVSPANHAIINSNREIGAIFAIKIFLRSLFIQSSFNYRGMQNRGFVFSLLPLAKLLQKDNEQLILFLNRHLQLFNTHPYLAAPIIGSVANIEEKLIAAGKADGSTVSLKNALAAPYAALGDSFFWGTMKPLAAAFSVLLACQRYDLAPASFLILYTPAHFFIRIGGFIAGYQFGQEGFEFIRNLDLSRVTRRLRWFTLLALAGIALFVRPSLQFTPQGFLFSLLAQCAFLALIILCTWGIGNGFSQAYLLYVIFFLSLVLSL